jgi:thiol-disulfide isomerase/thioredoxin
LSEDKKKEIIIEVERVSITCRRKNRYAGWCAVCQSEVEYLTAFEAAFILNFSVHAVVGIFHEYAMPDGTLLICLNSLLHGGENQSP